MATTELLERSAQLDALNAWWHESETDCGRLVFVGGEAGVGKTMLIQRFCAQAGDRARLLRGVCDALDTPRPLGPLLDIAASVGGELDRLLREDAPRDQIFRATLAELEAGPAILVIEDAQWADQATIDLLRFLGRRLGSTRAMVVVTYRDDEAGPNHPVRILLGDLATTPTIRRLQVPPLSRSGIEALIERTPESDRFDPVSLHRLTGGNPFFASEVLACEAATGQIPATVRDAVLARASRIPPDSREALEAAAIFDAPIPAHLLMELSRSTPDSIDACLTGGMLVAVGDRHYAFRHELARTAIYDAISPPRRHALHARALALLQESPGSAWEWALLASHAEAAGDSAAVLNAAPKAARRAVSLRAHREAAAQYARALRFADVLPPGERADLLEALSYECYLTSAFEEAIAYRRKALAIWRELGDRRREGDALRWMSRCFWFTGNNDDAVSAAEAALAVLVLLPPGRELAMAQSNRSQLYMLEDENELAIDWGERAMMLAEALGETEIFLHALTNAGNARMRIGDSGGRADLERALAMARAADLEEHVARALDNLGCNALHARDLPRAAAYFADGISYTTDHDLDSWRFNLIAWRGYLRLVVGEWEMAEADASAVLVSQNPPPVSLIPALTVRGLVRARRGDADASLDEALVLAERTGEIQRLRPVRVARAEAAWLAGDLARAAAELRAVREMTLERGSVWEIGELYAWLARLGENDLVEALPNRDALPAPHRFALAGDWAAAAAAWDARGCHYDAALALLDGDEVALRAALLIFSRLGARPAEAIAAQKLRRIGARGIPRGPRPVTRTNPANLTARELEILPLLIDGCQNSEIADQLYLSVKTVGHHVSSILGKLGVRRRSDVAAAVERLGIVAERETPAPVATSRG